VENSVAIPSGPFDGSKTRLTAAHRNPSDLDTEQFNSATAFAGPIQPMNYSK